MVTTSNGLHVTVQSLSRSSNKGSHVEIASDNRSDVLRHYAKHNSGFSYNVQLQVSVYKRIMCRSAVILTVF